MSALLLSLLAVALLLLLGWYLWRQSDKWLRSALMIEDERPTGDKEKPELFV